MWSPWQNRGRLGIETLNCRMRVDHERLCHPAGAQGGPPYNLAETVDRLPKDVLIANWSTRMTPESHAWLLDRGFTGVVKSNSRGATLAEQQLLMGNTFGCWYKVPWLVEGTQEKLELNAYGSFHAAAEYLWNHWTDLSTQCPAQRRVPSRQLKHTLPPRSPAPGAQQGASAFSSRRAVAAARRRTVR